MNKSTLKYIGKRLIISAITLFVILVVLFLMVRFLPGSPINNEKLSTKSSYRGKIRIRQTFIYSVCYLRKRYAYR